MRITLASTLFWAVMLVMLVMLVIPCTPFMVAARAADVPPLALFSVEVEQGDGTVTAGLLKRIDAAGVYLVDGAGDSGGEV